MVREDTSKSGSEATGARSNFIREIIDDDLRAGRHTGVVTRFPPEPNGYLHIGHAKSICLNFGLAKAYGGRCHLRFDDTNPSTEEAEYVRSIEEDIRWLGFDWGAHLYFASDYFERMYGFAEELIGKGLAYVDSRSQEEISLGRGTIYEPGVPSPHRDRPVEENLDLFRRMRAGAFPDGTHVLRARIDMASPNMLMRDPLLYRIKHARHHRRGEDWCIYPMYDFAHCIEDALEHVTHSICTLEFENNRELYDWILDHVSVPSRPRQYEFARLSLGYTVMSKRKLLQLVAEEEVEGWDDPRMPTIAGLRRRGVTPEAIRAFCDMIGVARTHSSVDIEKLEYCIRTDLNARTPRAMCVLHPLKVTITNLPAGATELIEAPWFPAEMDREGSRSLPFSRTIYIEREDFQERPPKRWHRLAPGREVRLRYGYFIRCQEVIRDGATGEIRELLCTYDPETRGGRAPDGRKVKGTIHWVSVEHAVHAPVRLYDRLFRVDRPDADPETDFRAHLNPDALVRVDTARMEPGLAAAQAGSHWQFERLGYFFADPIDSAPGAPVFNRVVSLRDRWTKIARGSAKASGGRAGSKGGPRGGKPDPKEAAAAASTPRRREGHRHQVRSGDPELAARFRRYVDEMALPEQDADILTGSRDLSDFFEQTLASGAAAVPAARWIVNDLRAEMKSTSPRSLPFGPGEVAALLAMVEARTLNTTSAKKVLQEMLHHGGDPASIASEQGLERLSDARALEAEAEDVLDAHPDEVRRYRAGETRLLGFFMGHLMRATRGAADPRLAREALQRKLG